MAQWTELAAKKARKVWLEQRLMQELEVYGEGDTIEQYLCKEFNSGMRWAIELVNLYNEGV